MGEAFPKVAKLGVLVPGGLWLKSLGVIGTQVEIAMRYCQSNRTP
jgi:hypothetical protein